MEDNKKESEVGMELEILDESENELEIDGEGDLLELSICESDLFDFSQTDTPIKGESKTDSQSNLKEVLLKKFQDTAQENTLLRQRLKEQDGLLAFLEKRLMEKDELALIQEKNSQYSSKRDNSLCDKEKNYEIELINLYSYKSSKRFKSLGGTDNSAKQPFKAQQTSPIVYKNNKEQCYREDFVKEWERRENEYENIITKLKSMIEEREKIIKKMGSNFEDMHTQFIVLQNKVRENHLYVTMEVKDSLNTDEALNSILSQSEDFKTNTRNFNNSIKPSKESQGKDKSIKNSLSDKKALSDFAIDSPLKNTNKKVRKNSVESLIKKKTEKLQSQIMGLSNKNHSNIVTNPKIKREISEFPLKASGFVAKKNPNDKKEMKLIRKNMALNFAVNEIYNKFFMFIDQIKQPSLSRVVLNKLPEFDMDKTNSIVNERIDDFNELFSCLQAGVCRKIVELSFNYLKRIFTVIKDIPTVNQNEAVFMGNFIHKTEDTISKTIEELNQVPYHHLEAVYVQISSLLKSTSNNQNTEKTEHTNQLSSIKLKIAKCIDKSTNIDSLPSFRETLALFRKRLESKVRIDSLKSKSSQAHKDSKLLDFIFNASDTLISLFEDMS